MRRFWLIVAGVAIGVIGFASGVAVTLRSVAFSRPQLPPQPIPTTRAPAPKPLIAAGAELDGPQSDRAIHSARHTENAGDDLSGQLAPSPAPLLVTDRPDLHSVSPTTQVRTDRADIRSVPIAAEEHVAVFEVHQRHAEELLPLIQLLRVTAAVDEVTNKLVVSGTSEQLNAVGFLLENLDISPPASDHSPTVADGTPESTPVLRLYHWPSSQLPKLHARVAEMSGVQLATEGEIVAVNATPAQHRELERLMESEPTQGEAASELEATAAEGTDGSAPQAATEPHQSVPPASIDTDAIAEAAEPRIVVTANPASEPEEKQTEGKTVEVPVTIASYRIASVYLAQDDLSEVAKKNKCVAALRKWLGQLAAGCFTANEVDGCIQLLLGLGLIAPAENRELEVTNENGGVRLYVNQQGEVVETGPVDTRGIQQVVLRPATEDRVLVRLARTDAQEDVSAEVGRAEAALALVPSQKNDSNEPDVLLIVRPVPRHAAQSESVTRR